MNKGDKLLLDEKEAAVLLSMSTHFLRRDRISERSTGIPFIRIGAAIRYRRVDLETWILEQTKKTLSPLKFVESASKSNVAERRHPGRPRKTIQVVVL